MMQPRFTPHRPRLFFSSFLALSLLIPSLSPWEAAGQDPAPEMESPEEEREASKKPSEESLDEAREDKGESTEREAREETEPVEEGARPRLPADERGEPMKPTGDGDGDGDGSAEDTPPLLEETTPLPRRSGREVSSRQRRAQGLAVRLEGGRALWNLDADKIEAQVGAIHLADVRPLLVNNTHNAPAGILHLGYNVLGHATVAAEIAATGWDVTTTSRGGGGLAAGVLAWHPAELMAEILPIALVRQRAWDVSLFGGGGWGAIGKDRALRGMMLVFGARAEIYVTPWLSLGATIRQFSLLFDEYVVHWDNDEFVTLPDRSGGSLFMPSFTLSLRVPTGG